MNVTQSEDEAKSIVPTRYEPRANKPLWQMDLRHRLGLEPGQSDAFSALVWAAIYGSESEEECAERLENHAETMMRLARIVRADEA